MQKNKNIIFFCDDFFYMKVDALTRMSFSENKDDPMFQGENTWTSQY